MIQTIKSSSLDEAKISKILTPIIDEEVNFSKIVVNKPWGYEYLLYSNEQLAIWILHIKKDCLTSMHCHIDKKTSLFVLSGEAICTTLSKGFNLKEGDGLIIEKGVFHSTQAISDDGITIMEIETPVKKTDLLRLLDNYGREAKGYESEKEMTQNLTDYTHITLTDEDIGIVKKIGKMNVSIQELKTENEISNFLKYPNGISVIIEGKIIEGDLRFGIADLLDVDKIKDINNLIVKKPLRILNIIPSENLKHNIKAIIFDFDGVLAKTMDDHYDAWKSVFKEYGVEITKEEYFHLEGAELNHITHTLAKNHGVSVHNLKDFVQRKKQYYISLTHFEYYPEVKEIINDLKSNQIPLAIVTGSHKEQITTKAEKDFLNNFTTIITGDMLQRGKPHPEGYKLAMEKLNVEPHECVIIENAPLGIMAAKSSGAYCIGITSTLDKGILKDANEIIEKFGDLRNSSKIKHLFKI